MAVWQLQHKLDAQVKENEKLSTKLAALRGKIDLEVYSSISMETTPTHDMTEAQSSSYEANNINSVSEVGSHDDRKLEPINREPVAKSQLSNTHVSEGNDKQLSEVAKHPPADLEAEFKERIED